MAPDIYKKKKGWLETPGTIKKILRVFYLSLVLLLCVDFTAGLILEHHTHFSWEAIPFFNAVYGFCACVGLIFIAKLLRIIVMRKEDYYD